MLSQRLLQFRRITTSGDVGVRRYLFTSPTSVSASPLLEASSTLRLGPTDEVVKLNVGGKVFVTLRSTIESNAVLRQYLLKAKSNGSLYSDGAVFIDRDATHFPIILHFLRNYMDGITYNKSGKGVLPKYVRLPKEDPGALQDLFVEAIHYQIVPLQKQLCKTTFITSIMSSIGGSGTNPIAQATSLLQNLRRTAIGLVAGTSVFGFTQSDLNQWFPFLKKFQTNDAAKSSSIAA